MIKQLSNIETMRKVKRVFTCIESAHNSSSLQKIVIHEAYDSKLKAFESKYKPFGLKLTKREIASLLGEVKHSKDFQLTEKLISRNDTLSKLMFATLWKNAQLHLIQHLIAGIFGESSREDREAIVFRQFGKSLTNWNEPIIDQHVLRAFDLNTLSKKDDSTVTLTRRRQVFSGQGVLLIEYKIWFRDRLNAVAKDSKEDYKYLLDKILFCLGKEVKLTRTHRV